ncbi:putative deoxyribonuclease TATDN3 isoform X2 [Acropora muricata]|uniref:putative deoxyribonuclease TATDN3 isoform X2 n=1 Tax=Acropora muricata TaxID=159855 RepID=UPI0034E610AD
MADTYGVVEETSVVDCHAHISAKEFDEDVEAVIEEAKKVGVKAVVGVTESRAEFGAMIDLHNRYPDFVAPCLGVHPVQSLCPDRSATLEDLEGVEELIREHQDNLVAIGEVGLDFTPRFIKTELDKVSQREVFSRQILSACFVWGRARICQVQPVADSQGTRSAKKNYNGPWQRTRTRVRNVATHFKILAIQSPRFACPAIHPDEETNWTCPVCFFSFVKVQTQTY